MCADWLVISTFFLGICALVAPYVEGLLERTIFAPNLRFDFELGSPYCHLTREDDRLVYYFRFKIDNSYEKERFHRASQAKNCETVLEGMWIYDSSDDSPDRPIKIKNFTPVNLNMGPLFAGITKFIDLNPSRSVFCDIGHVYKNDCRFYLNLLEHYNAQSEYEHLDPGDRYILQYGVYSGNSKHKEMYLDISWSGEWNDIPIAMFRELVIAPTNRPRD